MLNARQYLTHQRDDEKASLRLATEQANTTALKEYYENISHAIERMSIHDPLATPPVSTPGTGKYNVDRAREAVSHVSEIKDNISRLDAEAKLVKVTPGGPLTDDVIQGALHTLECLHTSGIEQQRQLNMIGRRSSKIPAVAELLNGTRGELQRFLESVKTLKLPWKAALDHRKVQRQAELDNGAVEYNSGMCCRVLIVSSSHFSFFCTLGHHFDSVLASGKPIVQLATLMVVACHVILSVSRRGCHWIFSMCQYILQTTILAALGTTVLPAYFQAILSGFPSDIRAATDKFHLESKFTVYAVCPKCHSTYKPEYPVKDGVPIYQERCNFRQYSSRCGELLVRPKIIENTRVNVPIKPYVVFDFKDWMAGLLARPGYEEMMDKAWDRMAPSLDGTLDDIFQGSVIREFKGPDKTTHFSLSGGEGAGRYLFSLGYDSFNPLTNKAGGKIVSTGVIALTCVNLPIELRHKPENMFLASIPPGPNEPPLDKINPYLRPIVDCLLEFWDGVRFTQTCLCALGRLVLCAIIALVCDIPAARKAGGYSSCKHEHFCTVCWCNKTQHGYRDIDFASWRRRTNEECRRFSERFRLATSEKAADSSFDRSGLRSSELLRLPYYDPTRFLVVDPMHNLFLGLIKEHFQGILGYYPPDSRTHPKELDVADIRIKVPPDETNPLPDGKKALESVRGLIRRLEEPIAFRDEDSQEFKNTVTSWGKSKIHVSAFVYVGRGIGCFPPTMDSQGRDSALRLNNKASKTLLAKGLLSWVTVLLNSKAIVLMSA
jgi:hypothetical protein